MASWRDDVIREGEFLLLPKRKGLYKVTLTRCGLFYNIITTNSSTYEEKSLQISDIVGCHLLQQEGNVGVSTVSADSGIGDQEKTLTDSGNEVSEPLPSPTWDIPRVNDPSACGFVVFAYPFKKKFLSSKKVRQRQVLTFEVPSSSKEVFEERKKDVEKWKNAINFLCWDLPVSFSDLTTSVPPPRGKMLLLINPYSGPGKAYTIFKNEVAPMLYEACIPYKVIVTEYAGHASELMKTIKLGEWYAVVIVSGDGLIFETINGIMQRDDWASSIKLPVGCLPGGSGNALCCAINYAAGEPIDSSMVLHSVFVLLKHRVVPMDLVVVHIPNQTIFSFLSVTWGIMADIDFESEKYRNLGEARFTVGAIKRIISLRTYKGRVSFLPVAEYRPKESSSKKVLSKIRRFSLRSRSSSKSTLCSLDSKGSSSPRLLARRSYSMDQSGYGEYQLRQADEKAMMNGRTLGVEEKLGTKDKVIEPRPNDTHQACESKEDCEMQHGGEINQKAVDQGSGDAGVRLKSVEENSAAFHTGISDKDVFRCELGGTSNGLGGQDCGKGDFLNNDHHFHKAESALSGCETSEGNLSAADVSLSNHKKKTECIEGSSDLLNNYEGCENQNCDMTILSETQEVSVEEETYHGNKDDFAPVPTPLLHPLDQDVPGNWVMLEGDFVLTAAVYQTHLGSDMLAAPDAHLHDGHIHLMMVREGISRNALLNLFLSFGQGGHVHSPYVESVKVLAFRLEPSTDNGNIMIDGERFPPSPIQGQILPGLARVMAIK